MEAHAFISCKTFFMEAVPLKQMTMVLLPHAIVTCARQHSAVTSHGMACSTVSVAIRNALKGLMLVWLPPLYQDRLHG